jgi:hypothetical protein
MVLMEPLIDTLMGVPAATLATSHRSQFHRRQCQIVNRPSRQAVHVQAGTQAALRRTSWLNSIVP